MMNYAGGSVAEWSARRARNPAVSGSSLALATCWLTKQHKFLHRIYI